MNGNGVYLSEDNVIVFTLNGGNVTVNEYDNMTAYLA